MQQALNLSSVGFTSPQPWLNEFVKAFGHFSHYTLHVSHERSKRMDSRVVRNMLTQHCTQHIVPTLHIVRYVGPTSCNIVVRNILVQHHPTFMYTLLVQFRPILLYATCWSNIQHCCTLSWSNIVQYCCIQHAGPTSNIVVHYLGPTSSNIVVRNLLV